MTKRLSVIAVGVWASLTGSACGRIGYFGEGAAGPACEGAACTPRVDAGPEPDGGNTVTEGRPDAQVPRVCTASRAYVPKVDLRASAGAWQVAAADFDGDGTFDLATTSRSSGVMTVHLGAPEDGTVSFLAERRVTLSGGAQQLAAADFDDDGAFDLAVTEPTTGRVRVFLGAADKTRPLVETTSIDTVTTTPSAIDAADVNADGLADVLVAQGGTGDANVEVWLGNGDGTFRGFTRHRAGNTVRSLTTGLVGGDDVRDIVTAHSFLFSVLDGLGDGAFAAQDAYGAGELSRADAIAVVRLDGDVHADMLVLSSVDGLFAFSGDGAGAFDLPWPRVRTPGTDLVATDLDGDTHVDVALSSAEGPEVRFLYGTADGRFAPGAAVTVGAEPRGITSADFNADGVPDVAVANAGAGTVSVLANAANCTAP